MIFENCNNIVFYLYGVYKILFYNFFVVRIWIYEVKWEFLCIYIFYVFLEMVFVWVSNDLIF